MNNIFDAIPQKIEYEIVEQLVASDVVNVERIISKGHTSPPTGWYDQDRNEWVIVLKGEAVVEFFDESSITLKAGDYIDIPAHKKHKVKWTVPDIETIWLAVHY